ncbi:hypothetical protein E3T26_02085 [Cryobacterium sp. TMT1-21]|nr:hypothetical protein E3T26_02085 [Cryobacterium sp. TMT1-21]
MMLYLIVTKPWARATVVIVGGMLVLGAGSDVSISKVVYAGAVLLCALISAFRIATAPPIWAHLFRDLILFGSFFLLLLMISSLLGIQDGTPIESVLRQAIFYLLILAAPLIGIDAGASMQPRTVYTIIFIVGIVAAVGFATDWLARRGASSLDVGRFVLSSLVLPAFTFSVALVRASRGTSATQRLVWMVPVLVIPVAMLVTGTRTNLVIFVAIIGVLGANARLRVPLSRMLALIGLALAGGALVFPLVVGAVVSNPEFIQKRLQILLQVLSGSLESDQSYAFRNAQNNEAIALIAQSPLFGHGVGYGINQTFDTPLASVMKLGIIGTIALIAFLAVVVISVNKSGRLYGYSVAHTAGRGLMLVVLCSLPFGTPFEDRGFGFALVLVFTAVAAELNSKGMATAMIASVSTADGLGAAHSTTLKAVGAKPDRKYGVAAQRVLGG